MKGSKGCDIMSMKSGIICICVLVHSLRTSMEFEMSTVYITPNSNTKFYFEYFAYLQDYYSILFHNYIVGYYRYEPYERARNVRIVKINKHFVLFNSIYIIISQNS